MNSICTELLYFQRLWGSTKACFITLPLRVPSTVKYDLIKVTIIHIPGRKKNQPILGNYFLNKIIFCLAPPISLSMCKETDCVFVKEGLFKGEKSKGQKMMKTTNPTPHPQTVEEEKSQGNEDLVSIGEQITAASLRRDNVWPQTGSH